MTEPQRSAISAQRMEDHVREVEAENARLKTLVGELLVSNQLLRERVKQNSIEKQLAEHAHT